MKACMIGEKVQHFVTLDIGEVIGFNAKKLVVECGEYIVFWPKQMANRLVPNNDVKFFAGEIAEALDGVMVHATFAEKENKLFSCDILVPGDRPCVGQEQFVGALLVRKYHEGTFKFWYTGKRKVVYRFRRGGINV